MAKNNRDSFVIVRLTKQEKEEIVRKAGKSISIYIRQLLGFK